MDSCTIDLGTVRAGIRANTAAAAVALRGLLPSRVVDDPDAPRNFSVHFSPNRTHAHLLFWGGCVAARSFDPSRIVRSLVDHLTAHVMPPPGLVWTRSLPFVRDGSAILMPADLKDDLRIVDRQLRNLGYVAVDTPRSLIDLQTSELVVADLLEPDHRAQRHCVEGVVRRREEPTVPFGRYPIERWVFLDYSGGWGPISRARATRACVLQITDGIERPDEQLLATVARGFESIQAVSMFPNHPQAAIQALVGLFPSK